MSASGTALLSLAMHSSSCSLDWMNMQDMWDVQWQRGPDSSLERGFVELSRAHCIITSHYDVKFQSALFCASNSCVIFRVVVAVWKLTILLNVSAAYILWQRIRKPWNKVRISSNIIISPHSKFLSRKCMK